MHLSRARKVACFGAATLMFSASIAGAGLVANADDGSTGPVVVGTGFNNPRQLSLTQDGVLLVAEAGRGGPTCVGEGEESLCVGNTGAISALFSPATSQGAFPVRVQRGLLSGSGPDGSFAIGSSGVSTEHFFNSKIYSSVSAAPPEIIPSGLPGEQSGKMLAGKAGEQTAVAADITAFEFANDPDGQGKESNPYAVLDMRYFRLVADAAANAVLKVEDNGNVSLFQKFPNITTPECTTATPGGHPGYSPSPEFPGCNFVPTSLALGPDSDVYVGGLASEVPGQGTVLRLDHASGEVKRTYTGFDGVTGITLDNEGSLYVSQLFAPQSNPNSEVPGVVTRVRQDGTRQSKDVPFPAGLAVDQSRNLFVSAFSTSPDTGLAQAPPGVNTSGQIWRMRF